MARLTKPESEHYLLQSRELLFADLTNVREKLLNVSGQLLVSLKETMKLEEEVAQLKIKLAEATGVEVV